MDTLVNVGIGGAANAAMDYIVENVKALQSVSEYANYIKLGVGVLGGSMISGSAAKYARPALDGLATVGASDIIKSYIASANANKTEGKEGTGGVPFMGGIGRRVCTGQRGFRRVADTAGVSSVPFMG